MKVLFYMGHPAHYHNVSKLTPILEQQGVEVVWVARKKDVLFDLIEGATTKTYFIDYEKKPGKLGLISFLVKRELDMLKVALKEKPDLLAGTDITIAHVAKLLGKKSLVMNEDDIHVVPKFYKMGVKYADMNLSPVSCKVGEYSSKTITYKGYQELAYLSADLFKPDETVVKHLKKDDKPYFILRFAELVAHHDDGINGIDDDFGKSLIKVLEPHGNIYITSERVLSPEFEKYRISISPKEIHHAMYYADMYIGDSQTMAAEAAVLGTPSVRCNDFVGEIGYLEELEHEFALTKGFKSDRKQDLINYVESLLSQKDLQQVYQERKDKMLEASDNVLKVWEKSILDLIGK